MHTTRSAARAHTTCLPQTCSICVLITNPRKRYWLSSVVFVLVSTNTVTVLVGGSAVCCSFCIGSAEHWVCVCGHVCVLNAQVSEQMDSLRVLFTDPVDYLVTPRVLASMVAGPILNVLCFCMGERMCEPMWRRMRGHVLQDPRLHPICLSHLTELLGRCAHLRASAAHLHLPAPTCTSLHLPTPSPPSAHTHANIFSNSPNPPPPLDPSHACCLPQASGVPCCWQTSCTTCPPTSSWTLVGVR